VGKFNEGAILQDQGALKSLLPKANAIIIKRFLKPDAGFLFFLLLILLNNQIEIK